ncbi:ATP-binding protein [Hwangdonia sp.]|uniref:ATP-binding protein n=1 Tax=Hwangdonia sp. TaxID=1883432 RepID=UPI003AB213F0
MKIKQKLILAFSVLILVLLTQIILNYVITYRANQTYSTLQSKITPAINILTKYESINKELNLITNNRLNGNDQINTINRFKGIIEVELTHIKTELYILKEDLPETAVDKALIEKVIINTDALIEASNKINNLLNNQFNNQINLNKVKEIWENHIDNLYASLDRDIRQLNMNYNRSFETYSIELSRNLNSVSKIIFVTGLAGIILGLLITIQVVYSIANPIFKLKKAALKISQGKLNEQIQIKGHSELAELGSLFNKMSVALKKSFNEQEQQINQIKLMNKELEQFVYVASHDLQEPLRTMSSYIGLVGELYKTQLDDEALKYMKHVEDASLRMKTLIKDLLDYSRLGKERPIKKVDCNTLVNNILLDIELIINETNATVTSDKLPVINGVEFELKQLFQNLISNGLKFRKQDTPPHIEIRVKDQPDHWLFSITDNGIGMDSKHFERVFVIFQRLHNKDDYKGTGIGLSVCQKIVEMHQGKIWIESELNKGSTFYFTIFKKIKKT